MEIGTTLQVAEPKPRNVHSQAHTHAPDYMCEMTPHIGIIILFRLMMPETVRAISALENDMYHIERPPREIWPVKGASGLMDFFNLCASLL